MYARHRAARQSRAPHKVNDISPSGRDLQGTGGRAGHRPAGSGHRIENKAGLFNGFAAFEGQQFRVAGACPTKLTRPGAAPLAWEGPFAPDGVEAFRLSAGGVFVLPLFMFTLLRRRRGRVWAVSKNTGFMAAGARRRPVPCLLEA